MRVNFPTPGLRRVAMAAAFCALAAGPVAAQEFQVQMDDSFDESSIRFTGELGHVYFFRYSIRPHEGQVAVCGSGYLADSRLRSTIRDMARDGEVQIGDAVYPVDLRYFTGARTRAALATTPATCRLVAPIPRNATTAGLRFGSGTFRN